MSLLDYQLLYVLCATVHIVLALYELNVNSRRIVSGSFWSSGVVV